MRNVTSFRRTRKGAAGILRVCAQNMQATLESPENPDDFFSKLLAEVKKFVNEAKLVHGDLSNYNILNKNETPVIIDVSQSVVLDNPISK